METQEQRRELQKIELIQRLNPTLELSDILERIDRATTEAQTQIKINDYNGRIQIQNSASILYSNLQAFNNLYNKNYQR